jgi:hypothetical protein
LNLSSDFLVSKFAFKCKLYRYIKLLEASREPRTLAVACHDLGEFATHYPAGRFLVQDIGRGGRIQLSNDSS